MNPKKLDRVAVTVAHEGRGILSEEKVVLAVAVECVEARKSHLELRIRRVVLAVVVSLSGGETRPEQGEHEDHDRADGAGFDIRH